jgi:hypothetical protein
MAGEDPTKFSSTQARELYSSISDTNAYFRIPPAERKTKLLDIYETMNSKKGQLSPAAKSLFEEITADDITGLANEFLMYEDHVRGRLLESLASQSASTVAPGMMGMRTGGRKRTMKKHRKGRRGTQRRKIRGGDSLYMDPPPAKVTEFLNDLQAFKNSLPEPKVSGISVPGILARATSSLASKHTFENPGKEYNVAIQYLNQALQLMKQMPGTSSGTGISTDDAQSLLAQLACDGKITEPKTTLASLSMKLKNASAFIKKGQQEKAFVCEGDIKVDPKAAVADRMFQERKAAERGEGTSGLANLAVNASSGIGGRKRTLTRRRKH